MTATTKSKGLAPALATLALTSLGLLMASEAAGQPAAPPPPPGELPALAPPPTATATTTAPPSQSAPPLPQTAPPPAAPPGALPPQPPGPPPPYAYGAPPYGQPYGAPPYGRGWGYPPAAQPPMPATLPYREGRPPPPGYELETQSIRGLWLSGVITLGAPWFLSAVSAGILLDDEEEAVTPLFAPVIGPFIAIGTLDTDSPGTTLLLVDGIAQATGVGLLIAGLVAERKVWVRDYFSLSAAPVVSANGSGLSLIGEM